MCQEEEEMSGLCHHLRPTLDFLTNPVLFYVMPIDQVILNYVDKLDILPCLAHVHENMLHCICNMANDTLMLYVVAT